MWTIDHIVGELPSILLMIVPGFITLQLVDQYNANKKREALFSVLYSILYSFIAKILYQGALLVYRWLGFSWALDADLKFTLQVVAMFLIALILAWVIIKMKQTKGGAALNRLFDKNTSPHSSVWERALRKRNGAFAIVRTKDGMVYDGVLKSFTLDPDDSNKEVLLTNFTVWHKEQAVNDTVVKLGRAYKDYHNSVLIGRDNIYDIEIFEPGQKK